ncbi:ribonuclease H-like domain-containing protein [Tanacetum coccineum]
MSASQDEIPPPPPPPPSSSQSPPTQNNPSITIDEYDLEEMDLKWQVVMISMRMKKFYKKTGRKLQFDAKELVGFDKTKVECYNCHKTRHFARECRIKGNQDNWVEETKDGSELDRRDSKALVTIDGEGVDWTNHSEDEDYALMACNSSDSDTEVWSDAPIIEEYESNSEDEHMTGNKAYLAEFQDFNGGPVAFGGSKGYITDWQKKSSSKKQRVHKESVSKQGRKFAKGEPSVQRDPLFDEIPEDTVDHMETENAQDVGRTREIVDEEKEIDENILSTEDVLSTDKEKVSTDKEKVSTDRPIVSTDGSKVSTDRQIEGTDEQIESTDEQRKGTEDHTEEGSATQASKPTSTIFGDDETIAKVLLNMSQAKAVSREKEKGVELKDIEETNRPKPTSTRSLLTLKPLLKIDPKDRRKKIEEEDDLKVNLMVFHFFVSWGGGDEKKFKQLESDEELARKMQEEWEGEEERNRIAEEKATNEALIRNFDEDKGKN